MIKHNRKTKESEAEKRERIAVWCALEREANKRGYQVYQWNKDQGEVSHELHTIRVSSKIDPLCQIIDLAHELGHTRESRIRYTVYDHMTTSSSVLKEERKASIHGLRLLSNYKFKYMKQAVSLLKAYHRTYNFYSKKDSLRFKIAKINVAILLGNFRQNLKIGK